MSTLARHRQSPRGLFGPYCRTDFVLADEHSAYEFTDAFWKICMRARYDSPGLRQLLLDVEMEIRSPGFKTLKHDKTTTVGVSSRDGRRFIIKRYNTKNTWHFARRSIRRSRAQNCFEFACLLLEHGIATAPPIAYIEQRLGPFRGRSWLVTEFVEGSNGLEFITQRASKPEIAEIAARIERLFQKLAALNITHGDMKATNIILRENRIPLLVDLDGMRQHQKDTEYRAAHARDKARFLKNWRDRPELLLYFNKVNW